MATKTWIGSGANTDYFNNANWSPTGAPSTDGSDDALITGSATYTISVDSDASSYDAGSLTLADPNTTLLIGGHAFSVETATTFTGGTMSMTGGQLSLGSGASTFGAAATLSGYGVVFGSFGGAGTIAAAGPAGSMLEIGETVSAGSMNLVAAADDFLQLDGPVGAGNTVTLGAGNGAVMLVDTADFQATIAGLAEGADPTSGPSNFIDVTDYNGFSGSYDAVGNQIILSGGDIPGTLAIKLTGSYDPASIVHTRTGSLAGTDVWLTVCFAAGTRILTNKGEIAVEDLVAGDVALTTSEGAMPVRWIGRRRIDLAAHPRPELAAPVRICRGAWGENQPHRDLVLSPDHCVFIDGKLIPAKLLVNGMTIVHERHVRSIEYFHVELDRHAVLLAEGVPCESYLDTGNRSFFSNAGLALTLHPEFHVNAGLCCWERDACAPLAVSEAAVRPAWQTLADRAHRMGFVAPEIVTTDEPDLSLVANGRRFRPVSAQADRFVFVLPEGVTSVRVASRACPPAEVNPWLEDWRQLGVAVSRILIRGHADYVELPVDHPALAEGWHAVEAEGRAMWRWTAGNAILPIETCGISSDGPITVELQLRQRGTYVVARTNQSQRRAA